MFFIANYLSIFFALFSVVYLWPRIVFSGFLNGKSIYYKLFFCVSTMTIISTVAICILAILKLITPVSLTILFYGSLFIVLAVKLFKYCFVDNKDGFKSLFNGIKNWVNNKLEHFKKINFKDIKFWYKFFINFVVVLSVIFLTAHFVSYAANNYSYGFSDIIRHEMIVGQTFNNEIFKEGYYPLGMHAIIGMLIYIFNIGPQVTLLYFGNFFVILFFIALYFWLKNTFKTKTAIGLVFLLFVVVVSVVVLSDSTTRMIYDGLHRFNWTLPEEMVLFEIFVSAVCLQKILNTKDNLKSKKNIAWLILFALSIATTLTVHYYTTLYQFIVCLAVFLAHILKMNKEKFVALTISVASGFFSGIVPMIMGLIYSGSFSWSITWAQQLPSGETFAFEEIASTVRSGENEQIASQSDNIFSAIGSGFKTFFEDGFMPLFPGLLSVVLILLLIISIVTLIVWIVIKRSNRQNYLSIFIMGFIFLLMYAAPLLDITRLLESYRLVICLYSVLIPFSVVWVDALVGRKYLDKHDPK